MRVPLRHARAAMPDQPLYKEQRDSRPRQNTTKRVPAPMEHELFYPSDLFAVFKSLSDGGDMFTGFSGEHKRVAGYPEFLQFFQNGQR